MNLKGSEEVEPDPTSLFALKATRIQARFEDLQWAVTQKSFPYLEAEGRADVIVEDAQVSLALCVRRAPGVAGGLEPKVALTRCDVKIASLDLTMEEHGLSWVFNALAALLTDYVRDYVCESLQDLLKDRSQYLLEPVNSLLAASWAPLSRALHLPDVADLPPLDEDHESEDVDIVLRVPGLLAWSWERVKEGFVFSDCWLGGTGQAGAWRLGLSIDDVKDALLVAVDGAQCAGRDRDDIVRRETHERRPRTLRFRLRGHAALRRRAVARARVDPLELFPAGEPRELEPLGLRLKTHPTIRRACAIAALVRGTNDEVLAAERAGVVRGALLCACTGRPRLWTCEGDATPQDVGSDVLEAAKEAAAKGEAFSVTLAPAPDRQLNPNSGFPLVVEDGLFLWPGRSFVVGGAIILPRAPENW